MKTETFVQTTPRLTKHDFIKKLRSEGYINIKYSGRTHTFYADKKLITS